MLIARCGIIERPCYVPFLLFILVLEMSNEPSTVLSRPYMAGSERILSVSSELILMSGDYLGLSHLLSESCAHVLAFSCLPPPTLHRNRQILNSGCCALGPESLSILSHPLDPARSSPTLQILLATPRGASHDSMTQRSPPHCHPINCSTKAVQTYGFTVQDTVRMSSSLPIRWIDFPYHWMTLDRSTNLPPNIQESLSLSTNSQLFNALIS
ncbi:hypothetical protein SISSUDRAFT_424804 [Sistotremastrum suecicum HHB10207 ss-3]|uniref:Uncharacterized protein n=1 Tax=Sistotremastrum suecicum HHB10207 ss-3 TaxID=1314776 RepID=A0A165YIG4_9AGAM|nr:hypothetical protein SISSUDRAFT_424804 [Sistotremastrum suecicum HHB10207 ss-3]